MQRLTTLYILKVLEKYATGKKLKRSEILDHLKKDYDIDITRKTLYNQILDLQTLELIDENEQVIGGSVLSDEDRRYLIDAAIYDSQIPLEVSKRVIDKLMADLSHDDRKRYKHHINYEKANHSKNEDTYKHIKIIEDAIEQEKKIKIRVFKINRYKEYIEHYETVLSPYFITISRGHYYLICSADRSDQFENRRVDRIMSVEILDEKAIPYEEAIENGKGFNQGEFISKKLYMMTGKNEGIVIRLKEEYLKYIVDGIGMNFSLVTNKENPEDMVDIAFHMSEESFLHFAIQYGYLLEVVSPQTLRDKLKDFTKHMVNKYIDS
ncbi:helix-turn-helix transcriptional regulator [Helcococcus massiliensis]|uniref:helix-turn-helix transcriptional regulator n=1 Tax=Helcococcus massiliensis TaxID=2040290 RepID=UPI000CDF244A|nr:WYL domain-containing protein [Helcococcus massiliensis]